MGIQRDIKGYEMKLLDTTGGNTKLRKNNRDVKVRVAGLSLIPDDRVCPMRHLAGCAAPCLRWAGRGPMLSVVTGRQSKLDYLYSDRLGFISQLKREITNFERLCSKSGVIPYVRLNVISDVKWESSAYGEIPQAFPNVNFYDYTKVANRLNKTPDNYKLMFSYSPAVKFQPQVRLAMAANVPMSAVFYPAIPDTFLGAKVINGDNSDIENLKYSYPNYIIGLKYKNANGRGIDPIDETFVVKTINLSKAA